MRTRWFSLLLLVIAVAVMTTTAQAQPGGRGRGGPGFAFGRGGGDVSVKSMIPGLLRNEAVQKEIELLDDQKEAIEKAVEANRGERPDFSKWRDMSEEERRELMEKMQKARAEGNKKTMAVIKETLLPNQVDRLREIAVQQLGLRALADPAVAKELGITDAQKKKMEKVRTAMSEKMRELFQSGDRENMREKMTEAREATEKKITDALTSGQKEKLKKMKGEPFDMPRQQYRGRSGGRGGQSGRGGGQGGRQGGGQGGRPERAE